MKLRPIDVFRVKNMAKITIHGYQEFFLINWGVKIYKNDETNFLGKIGRDSTTFVDVEEGDTLIFKCSFRKVTLAIENGVTDVFLQFDRFNGALKAFPANKESLITTKQLLDKGSSNANLKTILLILIPILIVLLIAILCSK